MKLTSELTESIYSAINRVIITFEDDTDVELNQIVSYDLDLDSVETSYFYVKNVFIKSEILNRFKSAEKKKQMIKHIHIEFKEFDVGWCGEQHRCFLDIPCYIFVRNIRIEGDVNSATCMEIRLEGDIH